MKRDYHNMAHIMQELDALREESDCLRGVQSAIDDLDRYKEGLSINLGDELGKLIIKTGEAELKLRQRIAEFGENVTNTLVGPQAVPKYRNDHFPVLCVLKEPSS